MNYYSQQYDVELDAAEFVENNLDALQEIHAKGYNGTDDDMVDAFDGWIVNFSVDELAEMLSKNNLPD